jgi:orotidine-5'-phosphate decarboxylase
MTAPYLRKLADRTARVGSVLCLGLDPDPTALPDRFSRDLAGIERFAALLVEAAGPCAAAIKPNLAFWESHGSAGIAALERIRASLPDDLPVLADAKRGDISSTAAHQATALFDRLGADAITVNPYVGREGLEPLLSRPDRFAYVLCRTSNPGASEIQGLTVEADPAGGAPAEALYLRVARRVAAWHPGRVGLVVGATAPDELRAVRELVPDMAFLVPGIGSQGGDVEAVLADGPARVGEAASLAGGGLLVNVSRGIAGAALGDSQGGAPADAMDRVAAAARDWARRLPVLP